jgi:hypothetical protein
MKRGETYDRLMPGGGDGYICKITEFNARLRVVKVRPEPHGALNMHKFEGRTDVVISPDAPTALYMPTEEIYISGYRTSDDSGVEFMADGLNNVYVKALSGSVERSIMLEYTVWCKWSDAVDHLEYYHRDYDVNMNLQLAAEHGRDIGYRFNDSLPILFRKGVPGLLRRIDADYFGDMIKILKGMSSPGFVTDERSPVGKQLMETRQRYDFRKTMEILIGYMSGFGCGIIPKGDMVVACVDSMEGACRHRALAFFTIAVVLGIPVRYCCSDCHAYPEVYFGNVKRWVGIDLGGCPPPQPKGPQNAPDEPMDVMEIFKNKLRMMGWNEDEDRFKKAVEAALSFTGRVFGVS